MEEDKNNQRVLFTIQYCLFGRILLIIFSLFGLFAGLMFMIANKTNMLLQIIGAIIFAQSLWLFIDVLFFKKVKITKNTIEKIWLFGKASIPVEKIDYAYRSFYMINRGKMVFRSFKSKKRNFFFYNVMAIHLLGISNYEQTLSKMKKVFKDLNIIKGDEYEWNN